MTTSAQLALIAERIRDEAQVLAILGLAIDWSDIVGSLRSCMANLDEATASGFIAGVAFALGISPGSLLRSCNAEWISRRAP